MEFEETPVGVWEEEMLEECRILLDTIVVQVNISDRCQWDPDPSDGFSVKGTYHILTSTVLPQVDATVDLVWHKQVPL